ncbi:MAG: carbohydrate porin [Nostocaceae cyanobacterium]|nr:carbohydrate porin [Nostocaceae cyanobacterium]
MAKNNWESFLISPVVFAAILVASTATMAAETPANKVTKLADLIPDKETTTSTNVLIQPPFATSDDTMAQVNSVSQLSDVQPTDWAFQALQSLVERYGCIAGYPDGTFKGNRAMTRYEFAAGLNACLNRVNELIATATGDLVTKGDLAKLQKLQTQFASELASLRGRVDQLEARTTQIEAHQFSTTTKLNAVAIFAVRSALTGDNARGEKLKRNPVIADRIRLNFESSFNGQDLLRTRLQALNLDAFSGNSTLTPEGDLRIAGGTFATGNNNKVVLDQLLYAFPVGKHTQIAVDANAGAADDFTNTVNPYIDNDGDSGAVSNFGTRNPIYNLLAGQGVGLRHQFGDKLELSLGYLASAGNDPTPGSGLFNGPYGGLAQLTIKPTKQFTLGLTYINSYNTDLTAGSTRANLRSALASDSSTLPSAVAGGTSANQGTATGGNSALPTGVLEALRGANLPTSSNSYGVEASFQVSPKFVIGGWAGLTKTRTLSTLGGAIPRGDLDIWNYAITMAFPDLGKKGSLGGIIVGMEPKVTGVSTALRNVIGKDSDTSLHIEGFYQYQLTDNISITPDIIWLTAPDHNSANNGAVIGVVRTSFTF